MGEGIRKKGYRVETEEDVRRRSECQEIQILAHKHTGAQIRTRTRFVCGGPRPAWRVVGY